jgi:signal peptidase I
MEPAFARGDLLFLTNPPQQKYETGDITVYKIPGADIPIVHRVLETHEPLPKSKFVDTCDLGSLYLTNFIYRLVPAVPSIDDQLLLTKGDNNLVDDIGLYRGLDFLKRKHIVGKVRGYVFPFLDWLG